MASTHGIMSVDSWREHVRRTGVHLHVFVDGEDVTLRCYRAIMHRDGIHGDAWLYKRDASGHLIRDGYDQPEKEVRSGLMEIKPGPAFFNGQPAESEEK